MACGTMEHGHLRSSSPRIDKWMAAIRDHGFISRVDLIMPLKRFVAIPPEVIRHRQRPAHYRIVGSSLGQLLQNAELFDILQKGTLTIQMDKPTFEAFGLPGNKELVKGQQIWSVSLDLDTAKRYCKEEAHKQEKQRICAYKGMTTEQLTWLLSHETGSILTIDLGNDVNILECIAELQPYHVITSPPPTIDNGLSFWENGSRRELQEVGLQVYEWLSLLRLESPRVQSGDSIDTFLSRYKAVGGEYSEGEQSDVCRISWVGLIGSTWFQALVDDVLAVHPAEGWLSVSSNGFDDVNMSGKGSELVLLRPSKRDDQYMMWTLNDSV
ncbi:hypothetical protein E4U42_004187 [Claviceps africana]|uniref:Uncharacterized protein n=1 Tax=Claviceps africana TaxID=83212 RepID=A0A8K0J5E3_9HYPO|nr:hypothetical protein E4U42_004187 [Claviceps africana]